MLSKISVRARVGTAQLTLLRPAKGRSTDEYDMLIEGIVRQAAKDLLGKDWHNKFDAMDFFRSRWFEQLTSFDGEEVIQKLLDS